MSSAVPSLTSTSADARTHSLLTRAGAPITDEIKKRGAKRQLKSLAEEERGMSGEGEPSWAQPNQRQPPSPAATPAATPNASVELDKIANFPRYFILELNQPARAPHEPARPAPKGGSPL